MTWVDTKDPAVVERWVAQHGDRACEYFGTPDPYFALWMAYTDKAVRRMAIVGCMDLEDWGYHDAYDDGVTPSEAAIDVLEYNGYRVEV